MILFDEYGRPRTIRANDLVPKVDDFIPELRGIKNLNGRPILPNSLDDANHRREAVTNRNSGFSVVGKKDNPIKKEDCNKKCTRTTSDKKMSQKGIDFLKGYESEVKKYGKHILYNDDSGYCTIGYGHLVNGRKSCSKISKTHKSKYTKGLTDKEAEDLFREDLKKREKAVNKLVKKPICQQEFDAMLSLAYNVGVKNLEISNVLKYTNMGKRDEAKKWFKSFEKSNGKRLNGLVKRRKSESNMYECGVYDSSH